MILLKLLVSSLFLSFIILIALFCSNNNDNNHVKQDGVKWIHINNVKITNPLAQKAFNWYKNKINIKLEGLNLNADERNELLEMNNITDSLPDDDEKTFVDALSLKYLSGRNDLKPDWLIMNPKEECLFHTKLSALDTVQRIVKNISYIGLRNVKNGLRTGCGSLCTKDVEGLRRFDAGDIVVTSQRIIFKGTNKSKTIKISNILSIDDFDDNGVIITMDNRVNPIVIRFLADKCFHYAENVNMRFFYNDLNEFYCAISKALSLR